MLAVGVAGRTESLSARALWAGRRAHHGAYRPALADPVQKVSVVPRDIGALGYTIRTPLEARYSMTRTELLGRIKGLLAGRAAEEIYKHRRDPLPSDNLPASSPGRESRSNRLFGSQGFPHVAENRSSNAPLSLLLLFRGRHFRKTAPEPFPLGDTPGQTMECPVEVLANSEMFLSAPCLAARRFASVHLEDSSCRFSRSAWSQS